MRARLRRAGPSKCIEIDGVGFAGVSGFGGGFGKRMLNAWGEKVVKEFVREAVSQALPLERALARLSTPTKIALHGHAHNGQPHGKTGKGADVYNVAIPVLRRDDAEPRSYRLLQVGSAPLMN